MNIRHWIFSVLFVFCHVRIGKKKIEYSTDCVLIMLFSHYNGVQLEIKVWRQCFLFQPNYMVSVRHFILSSVHKREELAYDLSSKSKRRVIFLMAYTFRVQKVYTFSGTIFWPPNDVFNDTLLNCSICIRLNTMCIEHMT